MQRRKSRQLWHSHDDVSMSVEQVCHMCKQCWVGEVVVQRDSCGIHTMIAA
jgi:hypothetical protein